MSMPASKRPRTENGHHSDDEEVIFFQYNLIVNMHGARSIILNGIRWKISVVRYLTLVFLATFASWYSYYTVTAVYTYIISLYMMIDNDFV